MYKIKYSILFFFVLLLFGCDSESAWDCVQTPGTGIEFEESVGDFHSVVVQDHIDLVVIQDTLLRIKVATRKNLVHGIRISNLDGILYLEEKSSCNTLKERSYTTVYLYAPELQSIRNASTGTVSTEEVWVQDKIGLISENHLEASYYNNGVFNMHLEVEDLSVLANGNSLFKLKGTAEKATISFYSGTARLEAETMHIQEVEIYHRGANHMLLYPVQAIRGEILNTGDVRAYNKPPVVEVEELYKGALIFVE